MHASTLVSVDELAAALPDAGVVLVDCRFSLADALAGERAWRDGHLPGAVHADLDRDLSDKGQPASAGRHPLPAAADFCRRLAAWGITPQHQVVAYDAADGSMAAARLWWLLRLLGHRRVAVLDGGFAAWQARGLPLETQAATPAPGHYDAAFDAGQVVTTGEVLARLGEGEGWLLDARATERFRGEVEPIDPVAGHMPGALSRPLSANLEHGHFRTPAQLRAGFEALMAGRAPEEVVLSCGSGVTACHNLLAMEVAGLSGARIYAPSWSGWISDRSRPVATGG